MSTLSSPDSLHLPWHQIAKLHFEVKIRALIQLSLLRQLQSSDCPSLALINLSNFPFLVKQKIKFFRGLLSGQPPRKSIFSRLPALIKRSRQNNPCRITKLSDSIITKKAPSVKRNLGQAWQKCQQILQLPCKANQPSRLFAQLLSLVLPPQSPEAHQPVNQYHNPKSHPIAT